MTRKPSKEQKEDVKQKCLELEKATGIRITMPWDSHPSLLEDDSHGVLCTFRKGNVDAHGCIRCPEKGCMLHWLFVKIQDVEANLNSLEFHYVKPQVEFVCEKCRGKIYIPNEAAEKVIYIACRRCQGKMYRGEE